MHTAIESEALNANSKYWAYMLSGIVRLTRPLTGNIGVGPCNSMTQRMRPEQLAKVFMQWQSHWDTQLCPITDIVGAQLFGLHELPLLLMVNDIELEYERIKHYEMRAAQLKVFLPESNVCHCVDFCIVLTIVILYTI